MKKVIIITLEERAFWKLGTTPRCYDKRNWSELSIQHEGELLCPGGRRKTQWKLAQFLSMRGKRVKEVEDEENAFKRRFDCVKLPIKDEEV